MQWNESNYLNNGPQIQSYKQGGMMMRIMDGPSVVNLAQDNHVIIGLYYVQSSAYLIIAKRYAQENLRFQVHRL